MSPRPLTPVPVPAGDLLADVSGALQLLDALDLLAAPARSIMERVHAELGLPLASLGVLRAVADGDVDSGALPPRAVTAVIDELRAAGLVASVVRGRVALDQADALGVRVADVVTAVLGADDTATLARLLERLAAGLPRS